MAQQLHLKWRETNPHLLTMVNLHRSDIIKTMEKVQSQGVAGGIVTTVLGPKDEVKDGIHFHCIVPLLNDITFTASSEFQSVNEFLPSIVEKVASVIGTLEAITGSSGETRHLLDLQVWKQTNPIQLNLELKFHTQTNGWADVWLPIMSLASLPILSIVREGNSISFRNPGVNLGNLQEIRNLMKSQNKSSDNKSDDTKSKENKEVQENSLNGIEVSQEKSKVLSLKIPGLFSLPGVFVEQASVTFSKELTELGAPLWGSIELQLRTMVPASDNLLTQEGYRSGLKAYSEMGMRNILGTVGNLFQ